MPHSLRPICSFGIWDNSAPTELIPFREVACLLSHVQLFVTPWTIACQAPLSMGFSKQEYCSDLPCPPPGNLPNPEIKPYQDTRHPLVSSALAGGVCIIALPGKPIYV